MGILFGSGQYLTRTANLPTSGFSCSWWSMLTTDLNTYSPQWMLWESGASNPRYVQCGSGLDGTSFVGEVHNSTSNSGGWVDTGTLANVSANVWYFWALTLSSFTGALTLNGYVRAVTATSLTNGSVGSTWTGTFVPDNFHLAHDGPYGGRFAGRLAHFKLWSGVLTSAELLAESFQARPVTKTNLLNYWPLHDINTVFDYGPSGYNWSTTGSPTTAEGPPVTQSVSRPRRMAYAVSGGGGGGWKPYFARPRFQILGGGI